VAVVRPAAGGGSEVFFVWTDQLDTPRVISDDQNRIRWAWDANDPFGNNAPNEDPSGLGAFSYNLRFPGQYFDAETGLRYNYFRDYDPSIGRYVESDPLGLAAGTSTFSYVRSAALRRVDPLGLIDIFIGGLTDSTFASVKNYYDVYSSKFGNSAYFEYDQADAIMALIDRQPVDEPINLIGHSLGGSTAADIAAAAKRRINLLITIDPVSVRREYSEQDMCNVRQNSDRWINVNAMPAHWNPSDIIAHAGYKWGNLPMGFATTFITSPANHGDFGDMMNSPGPDGRAPLQVLRAR
jgi:RHS repeat-associated protein